MTKLWRTQQSSNTRSKNRTSSALHTFQQVPVDVHILRFGQCWIFVEQIGHKGEVEFWVSTDDVSWGDKLSTAEPVGLLQHGFCPLHVVFLLNNTQNTCCRSETPYSCYHGEKNVNCDRRPLKGSYTEARHVDVYARLVFFCAFWGDLIQEVEIGPWVLENNVKKQKP